VVTAPAEIPDGLPAWAEVRDALPASAASAVAPDELPASTREQARPPLLALLVAAESV
jgi:hypothetical protein